VEAMMDRLSSIDRWLWVLYAGMLSPVVWSAAAATWPASSHVPALAQPKASLAFDQYLVNLRDVGLQPILHGKFDFTNVGERPLTITHFDPSCGCLSPRLAGDQRTYPPGSRGLFVVGVVTAKDTPGPHTYTIKVRYEDPAPHEAIVRFKLTLPERKVTVEPRELAFYQYDGAPKSETIFLTDYRGKEIDVTRATSTSDVIDVEVQDAQVDEQGNVRIPIVLHVPGEVPPGRAISTLTIETTDPEFQIIRIPVLVDGPPAAAIRPASFIGPPLPQTP
jgi:hypothetical protein